MLIRPTPGTDARQLHQALDELANQASNARTTSGGLQDRFNAYLAWTDNAVRRLWRAISAEDLHRLVRTPRYWAVVGSRFSTATALLADQELEERTATLRATASALDALLTRWSYGGVFVVADTSVYINSPDKLETLDFSRMLDLRPLKPVHLLVPIVVVDELDGLKQHGTPHVRWRARHTLSVLDGVFRTASPSAQLRAEVAFAEAGDDMDRLRGPVTAEIVFDPPGHTRLPINDDEIVDRALVIKTLAAAPVTLVTYDTGQAMRARSAGLDVHKIADPPADDEPPKRVPKPKT